MSSAPYFSSAKKNHNPCPHPRLRNYNDNADHNSNLTMTVQQPGIFYIQSGNILSVNFSLHVARYQGELGASTRCPRSSHSAHHPQNYPPKSFSLFSIPFFLVGWLLPVRTIRVDQDIWNQCAPLCWNEDRGFSSSFNSVENVIGVEVFASATFKIV